MLTTKSGTVCHRLCWMIWRERVGPHGFGWWFTNVVHESGTERDDVESEFSEVALPEELDHDFPVPEHRPSVAAMRAGLRFLDDVHLCETFAQRAAVMKNIPKFLWGSFRVALRLALEEISMGFAQNDWLRQVRGWRLFLVLPRLLLYRPWADLFRASQECSDQAAIEQNKEKVVSRASRSCLSCSQSANMQGWYA